MSSEAFGARRRRDPTKRFTDRVANYLRYRPRYPAGVLDVLREETGLVPSHVVADVGSGTGFFSELPLENGNAVYGVEPNQAMRNAAEGYLAHYPEFHSVAGSAEATTLEPNSMDYVTAAQAFHWFDMPSARDEFRRILKPEGWVLLIWNERNTASSAFLAGYEEIVTQYATEDREANQRNKRKEVIDQFFAAYARWSLTNAQVLDYAGLEGRYLSSSHTPKPGEPNFEPMIGALKRLFDAHQKDGTVTFEYETKMYLGRV